MEPTPAASDVAPVAWSWLSDEHGVEHAYHASRSADGISWTPACGTSGELRDDQVRRTGARKVCVRCVARLVRASG